MPKRHLAFIDPVLLARLRRKSRFVAIKARLRSRLQAMQSAGNLDETTRAHLLESQARIDRVLEASVGVPAL